MLNQPLISQWFRSSAFISLPSFQDSVLLPRCTGAAWRRPGLPIFDHNKNRHRRSGFNMHSSPLFFIYATFFEAQNSLAQVLSLLRDLWTLVSVWWFRCSVWLSSDKIESVRCSCNAKSKIAGSEMYGCWHEIYRHGLLVEKNLLKCLALER